MAPTSTTTTLTGPMPPNRTIWNTPVPLRDSKLNRKPILDDTANDDVNVMDMEVPLQIVWRNVALFAYLHLAAVYGLYLFVMGQVMWQTFLWGRSSSWKINNFAFALPCMTQ